MEHLYEKLEEYAETDFYPYHMPGHKRRLFGEMPEQVMQMDITEIDGFDNLHQPEGILQKLQEKAATLYGAEESFYLVGGSTCGILSAVSAALPEGGHLLMARNCHKSVYHAVYLRNLTVSYLYPDVMEEYDINDVITPDQVRKALESEPDIGAILLVSPTYEGRIADVEEIAKIVHEREIPLIIDEAHGAHLGWAAGFTQNSCQAGADLVIHSVHKTLPAMTQTALLHVNGHLIDRNRLRRFLHIYQSSSPSYILMASIDNALNLVERNAEKLFSDFRIQYGQMMEQLSACRCLEFLFPQEGKQDIGKLLICGKKFGLSGQKIYDILLEEYHLQLEMAAGSYCLAMFTLGDSTEAYERMTNALLEIDERMAKGIITPDVNIENGWSDTQSIPGDKLCDMISENARHAVETDMECLAECFEAIPLSTAWDMPYEWLPLEETVGKIVAEFVNLYPPGVPLLVPGEVMTARQYKQIVRYLEQKLNVQGVEQSESIYKIKVLRK